MADTSHYRTQVIELGLGEPQYVAELFGLHRVDNDIKRGEVVQWSDLERIESVRMRELTPINGQYRLEGSVILEDGSDLELQSLIGRSEDRYVLTGGVG